MKKTLIIANGAVAKVFLETIMEKYFSNDYYVVIAQDSTILPAKIPSSFEFHQCDYTSLYRIKEFISEEIAYILIVLDVMQECISVYEMLRGICPATPIVLNINAESKTPQMLQDTKITMLDSRLIMSNKFIERLPNVPLIPRSFGLGQGEIMEIFVPNGSIFAYRHIGSIQQKRWKIVGIYRKNQLKLSNHHLTILPNDSLLVIGEPKVLNEVYKQVKSDIGQFPAPFGKDIVLYIDMLDSSLEQILKDIDDAVFLNQKLKNNKLFIRVLNPSDFELLEKINSLESKSISIQIDYTNATLAQKIKEDANLKFGLVIVNNKMFSKKSIRKLLHSLSVPICKTGVQPINHAIRSFVILGENLASGENVASVIFDISKQLKLDIDVYDFEPDSEFCQESVKNYEDLSKLFDKKIKLIQSDSKNPIIYLRDKSVNYVHFVAFDKNITSNRIFSIFSTNAGKIASLHSTYPQIFIPLPKEV